MLTSGPLHRSSNSYGLNLFGNTPHTSSSRNRPMKKRKIDPMLALAKSLKVVLQEQENLRIAQERDREDNRKFQQDSNKNFHDLAKAFLDE